MCKKSQRRSLREVTHTESPRISPVAVDWIMAVLTAGAFLGAALISPEEDTKPVDGIAIGFAFLIGAFLLVRRRWPLGVFVVSLLAATFYMALGYPAVGLAFPLAASVYTSAVRGRAVPAAYVAGGAIVTAVLWRTLFEPERVLSVVVNMAQEGGALAAMLLLGEAVRSRRALTEETKERLRLSLEAKEREATRRVIEERLRFARDLHDVVAHTVTVIGVQANVASDSFDDRPEEARAALNSIQTSARDALSELRAAIGVMREPDDLPLLPTPGVQGLRDLVSTTEATGLTVELEVHLSSEVPSPIGIAIYRMTQEALTNVLRHADASKVQITLDEHDGVVVLRIEDDGIGATSDRSGGHGIRGMRERATSLGGVLTTGPGTGGGFIVCATFPLRPAP
jgi:signal transduction histidine kinase